MKLQNYNIPIDLFKRYKEAFREILSDQYFSILKEYVENESNLSDIAKSNNVSVSEVQNILKQSYIKLEKTGYVGKRVIDRK